MSDKSIASATWVLVLVTALLVIVTALLITDGWRRSREQETRWKHEDERRREEAKPSAVVKVSARDDALLDMCFSCWNLGSNTFFVDSMIVTASDGTRSEGEVLPLIVTPGTWVVLDFNPAALLGVWGEETPYKGANCVLMLRGATGLVATTPVWFYVSYGHGRVNWHSRRLADRQAGSIPAQHKIVRTVENKG